MSDRPKLEDRLDSVREGLAQEDVRSLDSLARRDRGMALDPEREIERRRKLAVSSTGNSHRAYSWNLWLARGLVRSEDDAAIVAAGGRLYDALLEDKPAATASERTLLQNVVRAQVVIDLALAKAAEDGLFRVGPDGVSVHPGVATAVRLMGESRLSLIAVGLGRRAAKVDTLASYLAAKSAGLEPADGAIPVEAVAVEPIQADDSPTEGDTK